MKESRIMQIKAIAYNNGLPEVTLEGSGGEVVVRASVATVQTLHVLDPARVTIEFNTWEGKP